MKKWNNAERPIDIEGDEVGALQRYTPEENEWRRMLMMDHDLLDEERAKRKGEGIAEKSKKAKTGRSRPDPPVASGSGHPNPSPPRAGPSNQVVPDLADTPESPPPTITTPESPTIDSLVSQLLSMFPDMCPEHATKELQFLLATRQSDNALDIVLTKALDEGYPRPTKKAVEVEGEEKYAGITYRAEKRRGLCYQAMSNMALEEAFPFVPVP
jgi:hypothetical protein